MAHRYEHQPRDVGHFEGLCRRVGERGSYPSSFAHRSAEKVSWASTTTSIPQDRDQQYSRRVRVSLAVNQSVRGGGFGWELAPK